MRITFKCSGCAARLSIGSQKAGQTTVCPTCRADTAVPALGRLVSEQVPAGKAAGPVLAQPRLDPAAGKKPTVAPSLTLPRSHLAAGGAALVLLCVLGLLLAGKRGGNAAPAEEQLASQEAQQVPGHVPEPPKVAATTPSTKTVLLSPDLSLRKPEPSRPPDPSALPELTPEAKPPPAPKPEVKEPEAPAVDPQLDSIVVKRRQLLDDEQLRKQLVKVPTLRLDDMGSITESLVKDAIRMKNLGQQYPGPKHRLLAQREDLAGLPMRMDPDCRLGKEPAENMNLLSRKMRQLMQESNQIDAFGQTIAGKLKDRLTIIHSEEWLVPEAVPCLMQMLTAENTPIRRVLIGVLSQIKGKAASAGLANRAAADLSAEVRELAVVALAKRPPEEYATELLGYLCYPWAPVADHAAEALVALRRKDLVAQLVHQINEPDLTVPFTQPGPDGSPVMKVREVVQVNHLRNCVLCHSPSTANSDLVRGTIPSPDQPLPTGIEYYQSPDRLFVRADITYLKQDFSVMQPVPNPDPWPAHQRFDYLVRERVLGAYEQKCLLNIKFPPSAQRQAMLFALRELSGRDLGTKPEDWKVLLAAGPRPRKPVSKN